MKLSTFTTSVIGAALMLASKAVAEVDYFKWPAPNAVFRAGTTVQFVVNDVPDSDDHDRVYADLHREDGTFVRTIRTWYNLDDDKFAFDWAIDNDLKGPFYIELVSEEDDDDVSRSFIFNVAPANSNTPNSIRPGFQQGQGQGQGQQQLTPQQLAIQRARQQQQAQQGGMMPQRFPQPGMMIPGRPMNNRYNSSPKFQRKYQKAADKRLRQLSKGKYHGAKRINEGVRYASVDQKNAAQPL